MSAPKLSLRDVGKTFRLKQGQEIQAIRGLSFDVAPNEICVIIGPSGCGKSTVLRLVAGLEKPTGGRIALDGREIEGPGRDRGMVFQAYSSFDWLTVQQNVEYGMRLHGVAAAERARRAGHFIELVQLAKFRHAYPNQLSGGMKQRVAIARTLANDPEILLMDEPFGALDSQTRSSMQKLLLQVWEHAHKTVLFVTHDIDEAILLGDSVYVMTARPGRIKEQVAVPIPRPRTLDMVMDPDFIAVKRHILGLLRSEIGDEH